MCDICHRSPCPSSCPNAIDRVMGVCALCGEVIRRSERGIIVDGETYHVDCLEDLFRSSMQDFLALFEHDTAELLGEEEEDE